MRRLYTAIVFAILFAAPAPPATAQSAVEVGVLECRGNTAAFIVGSVTDMSCVFRRSGGAPEPYGATMRRLGIDIGIAQDVAVAWAVFSPTRQLAIGDLAGTYVGGAASATLGIGIGANALVGGSNNSIALQPLSVQGQVGLSIAAGVASLELRAGR